MPIATPEAYVDMLQRAKDGGFAYPAINITSSVRHQRSHQGIRRRGQ